MNGAQSRLRLTGRISGLRFSTLAICLTLSLQWIGPVDSKICQTHDNKVGKCKRPRDCPALQPIVEKLREGVPLTKEEKILKTSVATCIKVSKATGTISTDVSPKSSSRKKHFAAKNL